MDIPEFYEKVLSPRIPRGGRFVEIGLFMGRSFAAMGRLRPDLEIVGIDAFDNTFEEGRDQWQQYGTHLAGFTAVMQRDAPEVFARARILVGRSSDMLATFADASVDCVYIDADHSYGGCAADCREALRIVRPGGVIAGHDFTVADVAAAVRDVLGTVIPGAPHPPGQSFWRIR